MKKILCFILIFVLIIPSVLAENITDTPIGNKIVKEAAHWLGSPYGYGGNGEDGYGSEVDCSGLVVQVYSAFGIDLPRTSSLQAQEGTKVELNEMIAGDIVCFIDEDGEICHVGIYIGGNTMIHSPRPEKTVEFSSYFEDWGSIKAVYGRRIDVESEFEPIELPEEINSEVEELLSLPNSVKTEHLKELEQSPETDITAPISAVLKIGVPFITVNGTEKAIDESEEVFPIIVNNRTVLPIRKVAEEFGAIVNWIGGEKGEIEIIYGDKKVTLWISEKSLLSNGETVQIDTSPVVLNGRTYLPIKFIADEFNWDVQWNEHEKTVTISANQPDKGYEGYCYDYGN